MMNKRNFWLLAAVLLICAVPPLAAQSVCTATGVTTYTLDTGCLPTMQLKVQGTCFDACGRPSTFDTVPVPVVGTCSPSICIPLVKQSNVWDPVNREFKAIAEKASELNCTRKQTVAAVAICACPSCSGPTGPNNNNTPAEDPLVISLTDGDYVFTSFAHGVHFDLNSDGKREKTAWTMGGGDDAFLALDRDLNGSIDRGTELFGDRTAQLPSTDPNGFRALAVFDDPLSGGNGDGKISAADNIYGWLVLWTDRNHDGKSSRDELQSLADHVSALSLEYQRSTTFDEHGNELRYWAPIERPAGGSAIAWNVFFARPGQPQP